jgi:hypothetical protein
VPRLCDLQLVELVGEPPQAVRGDSGRGVVILRAEKHINYAVEPETLEAVPAVESHRLRVADDLCTLVLYAPKGTKNTRIKLEVLIASAPRFFKCIMKARTNIPALTDEL